MENALTPQTTNEPDQHHRAGGGDDELADETVAVQTEQAEHQTAEERADEAEHQVHQDAVAPAAHDFAGMRFRQAVSRLSGLK